MSFSVSNAAELVVEYQKRLNELTASGWDQAKYQKILDWYQSQTLRITTAMMNPSSSNSQSAEFPNGLCLIVMLCLWCFL